MGEPVLLNPNSYENIKIILKLLEHYLITNNSKEMVFVGSDGPPYCLMSRIIKDNRKLCSWILTVSGKGRLNVNQIKTLFKILDEIILEPVGKEVLDFNTVKSYRYFIDCKDNHKAWQTFQNFLHGTTMELICLCCLEYESPFLLGFVQ